MNFAAIALAVGIAGAFLASNLQGAVIVKTDGLPATMLSDATITASIPARSDADAPQAMRLIDLKSGATCKMMKPEPNATTFTSIPFGPDCTRSPGLSRVTLWRSTDDGSLIMADSGGSTILEFAPGDGVLYESVYPESALITIVPAKS